MDRVGPPGNGTGLQHLGRILTPPSQAAQPNSKLLGFAPMISWWRYEYCSAVAALQWLGWSKRKYIPFPWVATSSTVLDTVQASQPSCSSTGYDWAFSHYFLLIYLDNSGLDNKFYNVFCSYMHEWNQIKFFSPRCKVIVLQKYINDIGFELGATYNNVQYCLSQATLCPELHNVTWIEPNGKIRCAISCCPELLFFYNKFHNRLWMNGKV